MRNSLFRTLVEKIELKNNSFSLNFNPNKKQGYDFFEIHYYRLTPIGAYTYWNNSLGKLIISFLKSEFNLNLIDSKEDKLVKRFSETCFSKGKEVQIDYNDHWADYQSIEDLFEEIEYQFLNESDKDICIKRNRFWLLWPDFSSPEVEPIGSYALIPLLKNFLN